MSAKTVFKNYTNPSHPGSFLASTGFKKNNPNADSKKLLDSFNPVSLHKPIRKTFPSRKILVDDMDDIWQIDLIDIKKLRDKKIKQSYRYILVVIDVLSKFAWVRPLKNKEAIEVKRAFEDIFSSTKRRPKMIYSDSGKEFMGEFAKFLSKKKIVQKVSKSRHKASIAERFIRTFKSKMWRMFTFHKDTNYIKYLQDLVNSYNNSYHSTIKTTPASVNSKNDTEIYEQLRDKIYNKVVRFKFKIGDIVRIPLKKNIFEKGYKQAWSKNIYSIHEHIPYYPPQYQLFDIRNKKLIDKYYYEQQLQLVPPKEYPFEFKYVKENAIQKNSSNENKKQSIKQPINIRSKRSAAQTAAEKVKKSVQVDIQAQKIKPR